MANAEKREASEKAEEAGIETAADFFRESSKDEGRPKTKVVTTKS